MEKLRYVQAAMIIVGVSLSVGGLFLYFATQMVWQSPYVNKAGEALFMGKKYKITSPLLLPHREIPSKEYPGCAEIVVKDYRYVSWINWAKRLYVYRVCPPYHKGVTPAIRGRRWKG